jgi:hypothetical protein
MAAILDIEGDHLRIIQTKFGWNWPSGFWQEDFSMIFGLFMSNLHNRSKSKSSKFIKNPVKMLKSSQLYLYSSNLSPSWLQIQQFWPFDVFSIFSNGGHLGYRMALTNTILKGDHLKIIQAKFGWNWPSGFWWQKFTCPLVRWAKKYSFWIRFNVKQCPVVAAILGFRKKPHKLIFIARVSYREHSCHVTISSNTW